MLCFERIQNAVQRARNRSGGTDACCLSRDRFACAERARKNALRRWCGAERLGHGNDNFLEWGFYDLHHSRLSSGLCPCCSIGWRILRIRRYYLELSGHRARNLYCKFYPGYASNNEPWRNLQRIFFTLIQAYVSGAQTPVTLLFSNIPFLGSGIVGLFSFALGGSQQPLYSWSNNSPTMTVGTFQLLGGRLEVPSGSIS